MDVAEKAFIVEVSALSNYAYLGAYIVQAANEEQAKDKLREHLKMQGVDMLSNSYVEEVEYPIHYLGYLD
jgi:hypothetical protein